MWPGWIECRRCWRVRNSCEACGMVWPPMSFHSNNLPPNTESLSTCRSRYFEDLVELFIASLISALFKHPMLRDGRTQGEIDFYLEHEGIGCRSSAFKCYLCLGDEQLGKYRTWVLIQETRLKRNAVMIDQQLLRRGAHLPDPDYVGSWTRGWIFASRSRATKALSEGSLDHSKGQWRSPLIEPLPHLWR